MSADLVLIIGGRQSSGGLCFCSLYRLRGKVHVVGRSVRLDRWWLRLKFQFLVARDHSIIFVIVQLLWQLCWWVCSMASSLQDAVRGSTNATTAFLPRKIGKGFVSLMCNRLYYLFRKIAK